MVILYCSFSSQKNESGEWIGLIAAGKAACVPREDGGSGLLPAGWLELPWRMKSLAGLALQH